ncbi:hypothetical protein [Alistipes indistinctus]
MEPTIKDKTYHFGLYLRSHLPNLLFYNAHRCGGFQAGQFCKADSLLMQ